MVDWYDRAFVVVVTRVVVKVTPGVFGQIPIDTELDPPALFEAMRNGVVRNRVLVWCTPRA